MATRKEEAKRLLEGGDPNEEIFVEVWTPQDIINVAENFGGTLTKEEAESILRTLNIPGNVNGIVTFETIIEQIELLKDGEIHSVC